MWEQKHHSQEPYLRDEDLHPSFIVIPGRAWDDKNGRLNLTTADFKEPVLKGNLQTSAS
jgi:hypothetical protein